MPGEAPEAAAELEHRHAGLQAELPRDQVQLAVLRLVERLVRAVGTVVGTGVLHGAAEHRDVQLVREVVVLPRHPLRKPAPLLVGELAPRDLGQHPGGHEPAVDPPGMDAHEELVELRGVPPSVHVGLAGPQGAVRQHARVQAFVPNLQVPGIAAVDLDACGPQQGRDVFLRRHGYDPTVRRAPALFGTNHISLVRVGKTNRLSGRVSAVTETGCPGPGRSEGVRPPRKGAGDRYQDKAGPHRRRRG